MVVVVRAVGDQKWGSTQDNGSNMRKSARLRGQSATYQDLCIPVVYGITGLGIAGCESGGPASDTKLVSNGRSSDPEKCQAG
jgi:hypothetical protein